jgi:hypothetical protein
MPRLVPALVLALEDDRSVSERFFVYPYRDWPSQFTTKPAEGRDRVTPRQRGAMAARHHGSAAMRRYGNTAARR